MNQIIRIKKSYITKSFAVLFIFSLFTFSCNNDTEEVSEKDILSNQFIKSNEFKSLGYDVTMLDFSAIQTITSPQGKAVVVIPVNTATGASRKCVR